MVNWNIDREKVIVRQWAIIVLIIIIIICLEVSRDNTELKCREPQIVEIPCQECPACEVDCGDRQQVILFDFNKSSMIDTYENP